MPGLVDIGKRSGMALGASLFTAAGQLIYASAAGTAAILTAGSNNALLYLTGGVPAWTAAPATANQPLVYDGSSPAWGAPQSAAVVAADVTHTQSNTTLSDVTGLYVPIGASATEVWFWEAYLMVTAANSTVDVKFGWTVPTAATMKWGALSPNTQLPGWVAYATATTTTASLLGDQTFVPVAGTANGTVGLAYAGYIFGGGTSGNVQLQFAQNTSDASNLTIAKGSMLRYRRLIA
jgi:hypothetical protein